VGQAYEDMVETGYQAMKKFDGKMIKKVGHRIPNYPALQLLWVLKFFEVHFHKLAVLLLLAAGVLIAVCWPNLVTLFALFFK
jgi:hypothetical protein